MQLFKSISLLAISIVIGFLIVEVLSRYLMPISPAATNLSLDGAPIRVNTPVGLELKRDLVFRQVANEFDVQVTIGKFGNRVPDPVGSPEIIFLGDSFTFGQGLEDDQTFPFIFCTKANVSCSNLGRSGTGTGRQVEILRHYLDTEGWRPKEVKLFVLAMTGSLMAGNDFLDNYHHDLSKKRSVSNVGQTANSPVNDPVEPTWKERILAERNRLLMWSNLARFLYFSFGPQIKAALSPKPSADLFDHALEATRSHLREFGNLAKKYGFRQRVYVLYPVQDLLRGTHSETFSVLRKMIDDAVPVLDTAKVFAHSPTAYYYAFDGHFNPSGSQRLAQYLLDTHRQ